MTDLLKRLQDAVDLKTDPRVLENLCAEALAALRSQGESAPTPSPAESVSQALAKVPNDLYWLIGKGKTHESEPLYACQIISPSDGTVMAEAEHDNLAKSITMAVSLLSREDRRCQKCGTETRGEEAYINGQVWCHPCADALTEQSNHAYPVNAHKCKNLLDIEANYDRI